MPRFTRADLAKVVVVAVIEYALFTALDNAAPLVFEPGPGREVAVVILSLAVMVAGTVILLRWLDRRQVLAPATHPESPLEPAIPASAIGRDEAKRRVVDLAE